jgi:hypothetical protein
MIEFEQWFLEVIGICDEKMSITVNVFAMEDWRPYYLEGLTPLGSVLKKYGLS